LFLKHRYSETRLAVATLGESLATRLSLNHCAAVAQSASHPCGKSRVPLSLNELDERGFPDSLYRGHRNDQTQHGKPDKPKRSKSSGCCLSPTPHRENLEQVGKTAAHHDLWQARCHAIDKTEHLSQAVLPSLVIPAGRV